MKSNETIKVYLFQIAHAYSLFTTEYESIQSKTIVLRVYIFADAGMYVYNKNK